MSIWEWMARKLAPGLKSEPEIREIIQEEVARMKAAMPITANYDPKGEGYRPAGGSLYDRDLTPMDQASMFNIAYFLYDSSMMFKRLAKLDKTFLFGEPVTIEAEDDDVKGIIDRYREANNLEIDFPDNIMWLSILGEQCLPVDVNSRNGAVSEGYVDPAVIKNIYVDRMNARKTMQVELFGLGGRPGKKMAVIRKDMNPMSKTYGKLVGECFFFKINCPPSGSRGRSDFLTLYDWIDGLERHGYNGLERAENLLNFIWDVTMNGATEEKINEWLSKNSAPPEPGSLRVHNENVKWDAVAPDLKSADHGKLFETIKSFIMGGAGRPDSWFGAGGKAYQTEAEQFGQVPIKDLDERQLLVRYILEAKIQFVIDQAVIAGRLSQEKADTGFLVNMPEISKKDFTKTANAVPQVATGLSLAETSKWIRRETAAKAFAQIMSQAGIEIDADEELEALKKITPDKGSDVTEDYKD